MTSKIFEHRAYCAHNFILLLATIHKKRIVKLDSLSTAISSQYDGRRNRLKKTIEKRDFLNFIKTIKQTNKN